MAKICFCAVGGSGMSALAQVLKYKNNEVCGSDRSFDQNKDQRNKRLLQNVGIQIYPQDGSMIDNTTSVLYASTAVEDTVPDIKKAKELNIPIKHRSDLLEEIFSSYPYNIAVGGTSGKSTVTAMIGYILDKTQNKPLVINGALLKNYENSKGIPNVILNNGNYCVIEADESDGSIQKYTPYISVIDNISLDHKSIEELQVLFKNFATKATHGIIYNADCKNSNILKNTHSNELSFGIENSSANFYATNIKAIPDGTLYTYDNKEYKLNLIGKFNVANAMCAIACCSLVGVSPHTSCQILEEFLGTKRRLEILGQKNNITIIDDFAHNPDKINASMSALKSYPGRVIVMFQPHGFAPMRMMGNQIIETFAKHLDNSDILLIPEIFFAGGSVTRDISSKNFVDYAKTLNTNAIFFEQRQDIKQYILENATPNDRIVLMGARDNSITDLGFEILENL
jgi:UDP-N-acetylmuramate--alanine ligase